MRDLAESSPNGAFGTLEQAINELEIPRIKVTRSMPSFKGYLQLGDATKYETAFRIPVERYFKTSVAKPPSASSFVLKSSAAPGLEEGGAAANQALGEGDTLTTVRNTRTYQITDESAPGGKVDVERDDLAKGYEYGRTAVHISQEDENVTTLETFAGLELIGFILNDQVSSILFKLTSHLELMLPYSMIDISTCPTQTSSFHKRPTTKLPLHCPLSFMPYMNLTTTLWPD